MAERSASTPIEDTQRWVANRVRSRREDRTEDAAIGPSWPHADPRDTVVAEGPSKHRPATELAVVHVPPPGWSPAVQEPPVARPAWDVAPPPSTVPSVPQRGRPRHATSLPNRLGAWLLDGVLFVVTLGLGHTIWSLVAMAGGRTPGMQLVGIEVADHRTGETVGFARMFWLRGLLGGVVAAAATACTLGIVLLLPMLRSDRRGIRDLVSGTSVVRTGGPLDAV